MEYSQWMAFERVAGPINGEWESDALAAIQEQLQQLSYLLGQAHFTDKNHKQGPIPKPERYLRPHETNGKSNASNVADFDDLKFEDEWTPLTEDELVEVRIDPEEMAGGEE